MATINVPGDAPTIQGGITLASNGDTVLVGPGIYAEAVTINKSITLVSSAGPANTIIHPPAIEYYLVSIEASNVVLSGFTITNPEYNGTADASGVLTYNAGRKSNIRITNCIIHDIGSLTRPTASFGTYGINSGPTDGLEIDHCVVYNIGNVDAAAEAVGIFVWGNDPVDSSINVNIHNNEVYNIFHPTNESSGIRIGGATSDVIIAGNNVHSTVKQGIVDSSGMLGPITIEANTVDGASIYGLLLRSPFPQTVTGNTISHNGTGIMITGTSSAPVIHQNNIFGNTIGVNNASAFVVDVTNNWWGRSTGPNSPGADTIVGVTIFTPWLLQPFPPPVRGVKFW